MPKTQIQHFLLVFDHSQGRLLEIVDFGHDGDAAVASYAAREEQYRDDPQMDILLVGSDSIATVQATHANYFDGSAAIARLLARFTTVSA